MTLIKSISGIRGTIGGITGENLTAQDIVECTAGFAKWVRSQNDKNMIVIGRDGRISGKIVSNLVCNTLLMMGFDILDLGLSTTPTVEIAVPREKAAAGIIITASHNPRNWNALKFLNSNGEFISKRAGEEILQSIQDGSINYPELDQLGTYKQVDGYFKTHIEAILKIPFLDANLIQSRKYHIVVDCINSTGALAIPPLLDALGCTYRLINEEVSGDFAHNPEPLPKNLTQLSEAVLGDNADLGISVDPDVDRLAFICEDGSMFGEEYTLVAAADFVLSKVPGNTVSNLSSTGALKDITLRYNGKYTASAVGEVNVVNAMKETNAVIGREGNGGVIYPGLHYGRDALVGIAFVLNLLAERNISLKDLRQSYPDYTIIKNKIQLTPEIQVDSLLTEIQKIYQNRELNTIDGLKIHFENAWVHLRKSNTEPIIRVYAEARTEQQAQDYISEVQKNVDQILNT